MFKSELNEFLSDIHEIDEAAFIVTSKIDNIYGNFLKISSNKYEKIIDQHSAHLKVKKEQHKTHQKEKKEQHKRKKSI
jgi:hypothetical protein